ncbi:MAG: hypothetical protein QM744_09320 [Mesorhizobium sp.]
MLILSGAAATSLVLGTEEISASSDAVTEESSVAASRSIRIISDHNFLYSDRHQKLYPDIRVYLNGRTDNIERFVDCLQRGADVREICEELELRYRGDVWFAMLLVHLHMRDGLVDIPGLEIEPPAQLASNIEKFELDWKHRNDRWTNAKEHFRSAKTGAASADLHTGGGNKVAGSAQG